MRRKRYTDFREKLYRRTITTTAPKSKMVRTFIWIAAILGGLAIVSALVMGMMMLPPVVISLPFKIMLFVLIDGWTLLVGSMVKSFG